MTDERSLSREFTRELGELLEQGLAKMHHCLNQLDDAQLWCRPAGSPHSIGNLLLHVTGNLRQWGWISLTEEPDRRDRAAEFDSPPVDRSIAWEPLVQLVADCRERWATLSSAELLEQKSIQGFDVTVAQALLHTATHLVGHAHQVVLLTRQLRGDQYRFHWTPDMPRDRLPI